jgi:hypothetical protein
VREDAAVAAVGLVPSERSSGERRRQGRITCAGNRVPGSVSHRVVEFSRQ